MVFLVIYILGLIVTFIFGVKYLKAEDIKESESQGRDPHPVDVIGISFLGSTMWPIILPMLLIMGIGKYTLVPIARFIYHKL